MTVDFVPWSEFIDRLTWKQGEHLTLLGPTGQGKTTLALQLLRKRKYVVVFATKRRDPLISGLKKEGYQVHNEFTAHFEIAPRVVLQPKRGKGIQQTLVNQRVEFQRAMERAYDVGGWTIYMDEALHVCDTLKLADSAKMLWHQGRTLGVTMVAGTQRPTNIPLMAYSQATHLFLWRVNDEVDMRRIGGMGIADSKAIRDAVSVLESHEVLYLNTRSGELLRTKAKVI